MHPTSGHRLPRALIALFILTLVGSSFTSGWYLGRQRGVLDSVPQGEGRVLDQEVVSASLSKDVSFEQFWDVWKMVKENYYQQPVSDKDLFYGALHGMVSASGDRYTTYFDPEEAAEFMSSLNGTFEGIGAEIGIKDELLQIVAPLPDSPAENAGLASGDVIFAIDGRDTEGMSVEQAVSLIRGAAGTVVTLTVAGASDTQTRDVPITRDTIVVNSVRFELDETTHIATISIYTFNDDTSSLFNKAVNELLAKGAKGIILDLRSNPGGLLTTAIDIASAWVGYQTVVIEKTGKQAQEFAGVSAPRLEGVPTVVLIDGGSASASEIVSGALQDYGFATLVGTKTFGKGSVQDYRQLPDGSAVKITVAQWYTPDGRTINETGIDPDIVIEYTEEDAHEKRDPQKDKAIELLLAK